MKAADQVAARAHSILLVKAAHGDSPDTKVVIDKIFKKKNFSHLHYLSSNQISFPGTKDSSEVLEVLRRIGSWKWGMRRGIATFLPVVLPFTKEIHWPGCHNTLVSQHSCICPCGRQKMLNSKDICHSQNLCSVFNNQIFFICGENRPKLWSLERFPTPLPWP